MPAGRGDKILPDYRVECTQNSIEYSIRIVRSQRSNMESTDSHNTTGTVSQQGEVLAERSETTETVTEISNTSAENMVTAMAPTASVDATQTTRITPDLFTRLEALFAVHTQYLDSKLSKQAASLDTKLSEQAKQVTNLEQSLNQQLSLHAKHLENQTMHIKRLTETAQILDNRITEQTHSLEKKLNEKTQELSTQFTVFEKQSKELYDNLTQRCNSIEKRQVDMLQAMATKQNLDEKFNTVETKISETVTQEVDTKVNKLYTDLNAQVKTAEEAVVNHVLNTVEAQLSDFSTDITLVKETVKTIPNTIDSLVRDVKNLKLENQALKATVGHIADTTDSQRHDDETQSHQSSESVRHIHDAEIENIVETVSNRLTAQNNVTVKTLQEEISQLKSMLPDDSSRKSTHFNNNTPDADSSFNRSCSNDRPQGETSASGQNENLHNRMTHNFQSVPHNSTGTPVPRIVYNNIDSSRSLSGDRSVATLLMEENLIKYHQFQTFKPEDKGSNPVVFIKGFRGVMPESWSERRKIRFVAGFLQGEGALWATDAIDYCETLQDFENAFLNKYWSAGVQERLRNEIYNPQPYNEKSGNLRRYFEKYLKKSKFLDMPLPPTEVLRIIKSKLPYHIRRALHPIQDRVVEDFLTSVDGLDLINEDERAFHNTYNSNISRGNNNKRNHHSNAGQVAFVNTGGNQSGHGVAMPFDRRQSSYAPPSQPQQQSAVAGGGDANNFHQHNNNNGTFRRKKNHRFNPGYQNQQNHSQNRYGNSHRFNHNNNNHQQSHSYYHRNDRHNDTNHEFHTNVCYQNPPPQNQINTGWMPPQNTNNGGSVQNAIPVSNISYNCPSCSHWGQANTQGLTLTDVTHEQASQTTTQNPSN